MKTLNMFLICIFLICGCEQSTTPVDPRTQNTAGTVAFSFDKANAPAEVKILTTVLSRSGFSPIEKSIQITTDTSAVVLFEQVAVGTWEIKIDAKNEMGQIIYTGQSEVIVLEGTVSMVNLVMSPVASGVGSVQINVSWGGSKTALFPKTIGSNNREAAMCVLQSKDGGFVLGGSAFRQNSSGDAWLVKTSARGEVLWSEYFGGNNEDRINDVIQTSDGGYILVGYKTGNDEDSWIAKVDSLGKLIWEKIYGGIGADAFLKIKKGNEGLFWVCGYYFTDNFFEGRVIKVNENGNALWSKIYGGSGGDFAMNLVPLTNGEAIVIGNYGSLPGKSYDFWMFKINTDGNIMWESFFGGSKDDRAAGICLSYDNGYILTGYTTSFGNGTQDAWVMCVNDSGSIQWSKTIGERGVDYLLCVERTVDNNFIATGISTSYGNGQQGWAVKIDPLGQQKWLKNYGGSGYEVISEHHNTQDGGFVFAGSVLSPNSSSEDFWLGKANSNGDME